MNGYLLDTNVVSELVKRSPHPAVVNFLSAQNDLWLSAIAVTKDLSVATRNVVDFDYLGVEVINPWETS